MFINSSFAPHTPIDETEQLEKILSAKEDLSASASTPAQPKFKVQEPNARSISSPLGIPLILSDAIASPASSSATIHSLPSGHINIIPIQIGAGIFIGEGKAQSGEKFFLKMEQINNDNYEFWRKYLNATNNIAGGGRSLLEGLMLTTKTECDENGNTRYVNSRYDDCSALLGLNRTEFQQLIDSLGKGGYLAGPEHYRKRSALLQIYAGSSNFPIARDGQHYAIFATKTRDFATRLPNQTNNAEPRDECITLKEYIIRYGDLLMCVGSWFTGSEQFHNRGIFRNPINMIENTYKGIAMVMHGFSAAVAQKFFPERKSMIVKPLASMQHLICISLKPEDYVIHDKNADLLIKQSNSAFVDGDGFESGFNDIRVDALARYYTEHALSRT